MPRGRHLRGRTVTAREQRMYEHVLAEARRSGRYGRRAKEVAARTVMKRHGGRRRPRMTCRSCGGTYAKGGYERHARTARHRRRRR